MNMDPSRMKQIVQKSIVIIQTVFLVLDVFGNTFLYPKHENMPMSEKEVEVMCEKYGYTTEKPYRDADLLEKLYWEEDMSQLDIADELDCSVGTVSEWMNKLNIEAQKPTYERPPNFCSPNGYERWQTRIGGEIKHVKVHRLLAVAEFGQDAIKGKDVHHKNRITWDNRPKNIEVKDPKEHKRDHADELYDFGETPWRDEDKVRELYIRKSLSAEAIADRWECSTKTVQRWIDNHDIEMRSKSEAAQLRCSTGN